MQVNDRLAPVEAPARRQTLPRGTVPDAAQRSPQPIGLVPNIVQPEMMDLQVVMRERRVARRQRADEVHPMAALGQRTGGGDRDLRGAAGDLAVVADDHDAHWCRTGANWGLRVCALWLPIEVPG